MSIKGIVTQHKMASIIVAGVLILVLAVVGILAAKDASDKAAAAEAAAKARAHSAAVKSAEEEARGFAAAESRLAAAEQERDASVVRLKDETATEREFYESTDVIAGDTERKSLLEAIEAAEAMPSAPSRTPAFEVPQPPETAAPIKAWVAYEKAVKAVTKKVTTSAEKVVTEAATFNEQSKKLADAHKAVGKSFATQAEVFLQTYSQASEWSKRSYREIAASENAAAAIVRNTYDQVVSEHNMAAKH